MSEIFEIRIELSALSRQDNSSTRFIVKYKRGNSIEALGQLRRIFDELDDFEVIDDVR